MVAEQKQTSLLVLAELIEIRQICERTGRLVIEDGIGYGNV
jgi:hypothetical protein